MAPLDPKERIGTEMTAPATQAHTPAPANSAVPGHHSKVVARINRGHGKGMGDNPNQVPFTPHE